MEAQARWGISQHGVLTYGLVRPIPLQGWRMHDPHLTTDCSGAFTCITYSAGVGDPNGLGYSGQGNTATIAEHLPHVARVGLLEVGDAILFAPSEEAGHVVMVIEPGDDPLCFSFGFQGGPIAIRYSDEVSARREAGEPLSPIVYARTLPPTPRKRITMYRDGKPVAEMNHPKLYVRTHKVFSEPWTDVRFHNHV
jgi:hypothetical protein